MIRSSSFLFHEEVAKIKYYLEKSSYPLSFIDKQVRLLLENRMNEKLLQLILPMILLSSMNYLILAIFQQMLRISLIHFVNFTVRTLILRFFLIPFKVDEIFNKKERIPKSLKSFVLYNFVFPSINACYIW